MQVRVEPELLRRLRERSEAEGTSLSGLVKGYCRKGLEGGVRVGDGGKTMRGETFEETRDRSRVQDETGEALARFERGQRLTSDELSILNHDARWGSDGYPIFRLGAGWSYERLGHSSPIIYPTKREAIIAWEIIVSTLLALSGLEARERATP